MVGSYISVSFFEAYDSNRFQSSSHTQNMMPWMLSLKASECPDESGWKPFCLYFFNDRHIAETEVLKVLLGGLDASEQ